MKLQISISALLLGGSSAFAPFPTSVRPTSFLSVFRDDLLETAQRLKEKNGVFILDKNDKNELEDLVSALEREGSARDMTQFVGDWTLVCTTSSNLERPDFIPENPIRQALVKASNQYVTVTQRIRAENDDRVVDRVDNVIEYQYPEQLGKVVDGLSEPLANLQVFNPLEISDTKVILCHKAKIMDSSNDDKSLFDTKIGLESVILNVAGQSTVLDPNGKDVASINLPFASEFGNSGVFQTTYLDDKVRVSRGRVANAIDQLRVFVRATPLAVEEEVVEVEEPTTETETVVTTTTLFRSRKSVV